MIHFIWHWKFYYVCLSSDVYEAYDWARAHRDSDVLILAQNPAVLSELQSEVRICDTHS